MHGYWDIRHHEAKTNGTSSPTNSARYCKAKPSSFTNSSSYAYGIAGYIEQNRGWCGTNVAVETNFLLKVSIAPSQLPQKNRGVKGTFFPLSFLGFISFQIYFQLRRYSRRVRRSKPFTWSIKFPPSQALPRSDHHRSPNKQA